MLGQYGLLCIMCAATLYGLRWERCCCKPQCGPARVIHKSIGMFKVNRHMQL